MAEENDSEYDALVIAEGSEQQQQQQHQQQQQQQQQSEEDAEEAFVSCGRLVSSTEVRPRFLLRGPGGGTTGRDIKFNQKGLLEKR